MPRNFTSKTQLLGLSATELIAATRTESKLLRGFRVLTLVVIAALFASLAFVVQDSPALAAESDFTSSQNVTYPSRTIIPKAEIEVPITGARNMNKPFATDGTNLWVEANVGVLNKYSQSGQLLGSVACGSGTLIHQVSVISGYVWALNYKGFVCQIDPLTLEVVHIFNPSRGDSLYAGNESMTVVNGILFFPVNVTWCKQLIFAYNITTYQYSTTAVQDDNCVSLNNEGIIDTYTLTGNAGSLWTTNRAYGNNVLLKKWEVSIGSDGVPVGRLLLSLDLTQRTGIKSATAPVFVGNQMWFGAWYRQSAIMALNAQTGDLEKIVPMKDFDSVYNLVAHGTRIWFFGAAMGEYDTVTSKVLWAFRNQQDVVEVPGNVRMGSEMGDLQGHLPVPTIVGSRLKNTQTGLFLNDDLWVLGQGFINSRFIYNMGSIPDPTMPSAPTGIKIIPGAASTLVTFHVPDNDGGAGLKYHTVTASPGGQTCKVWGPNVYETSFNSLDTHYYNSDYAHAFLNLSCTLAGVKNTDNFSVSVVSTSFLGDGERSAPAVHTARSYAPPVLSSTLNVSKFGNNVISMTSNGSQIYLNEDYEKDAGYNSYTEVWDPATNTILYKSARDAFKQHSFVKVGDSMYTPGNGKLWKFTGSDRTPVAISTPGSGNFYDIAANSSTIVISTGYYGLAGISATTGERLWTNSRITYSELDWAPAGYAHGLAIVGNYAYSGCRSIYPKKAGDTYWQFGGNNGQICKISLADGSVVDSVKIGRDFGFDSDPFTFTVVAAGENIAVATAAHLMIINAQDLSLVGAAFTNGGQQFNNLVTIGKHLFQINGNEIKQFSLTGKFETSFIASSPSSMVEHQGDLYVYQNTSPRTVAKYILPADPTAPGIPSSVTAKAGGESATVSWTAPSNGGAALESYTVTATNTLNASNGGQSCVTLLTSCVVSGLTDGEPYSFSVVATNWVGTSVAGVSNVVTPTPQVANLVVSSGDRSIAVSWGVSHPSARFVWYRVSTTVGDGTVCVTTLRSCVIRDLDNGTEYSVQVEAFDDLDVLASSLSSALVVPVGLPGVATNVTAVPSVSSATVSWSAAYSNGGVVSYVVTSSPGARTCSSSSTSCTISGLTNGVVYTFKVLASNSFGSGYISEASNSVSPSLVPLAVSNIQAWGSDSSALVRWSGQDLTGSLKLVSYVVSDGLGDFCSTVDNSCLVTGLSNGSSYTFTVTAYYDNGLQVVSLPSNAVTPPGVSGVLSGVSVVADNGRLRISWSAVGGANVSYVAVASDGSSCATSALTCDIDGLVNGSAYSITVYGMNQGGSQWQSAPVSASPVPTSPDTPTSVDVSVNDGSITVSWNPADDNGSAVTSYLVSEVTGSGLSCVTSGLSCTITGLTNGRVYSFRVSAANVAGSSAPSALISATPAALPGVALNVVAVAGDRQALISWDAPLEAGGNTSYQVSAANDSSVVYCITVGRSCTVTGLVNGQSYAFAVQTLSDTGESAGVALSNSVDVATVPDAPSVIAVVAGSTKVTVLIGAPEVSGGSPVLSYTVLSSTGLRCVTSSLECTFLNLANGVPLTFTVVAVNAVGASVASVASAVAIPQGLSSVPLNVKAVGGSGKVTLSWSTPSNNGGSAIQSYRVEDGEGHFCVTSGLTCTVSGLTNGVRYDFRVVAINAVGSSSAVLVTGTAFSAPDVVTDVTASFVGTTALVQFSAAGGNGYPVKYVVTDLFGRKCVTSTLSCRIVGLSYGVANSFTVVATSVAGVGLTSLPSNTIIPVAAPSTPSDIRAVAGNASVAVSWAASAANGTAVTSYVVSNSLGDSCVTAGLTCTVSGLVGGRSYKFVVQAVNAFGVSAKSKTASATPASRPLAPQILKATPLNGSTQVTFVPGAGTGSPVTAYEYSVDGGVSFKAATWNLGSKSFIIPGLVNGTQYGVQVRALNAMGVGDSSSPKLVTPFTTPGAPSLVSLVGGSSSITMTFSAPVNNGGSSVVGYSYSIDGGVRWLALPVGTVSGTVTISNLKPKWSYRVLVRASNVAGSGLASNALTVTTK